MNNVFDFFEKHTTLSSISKEMIMTSINIVKFKRNTIIINEGEASKYMYVIKEGLVKGFYFKNGEYKVASLWKEMDTFGDVLTYISGRSATKSYIAIEDVEAYQVDVKKFRALFEQSHEICNLGRIIIEQFIVQSELFNRFILNKSAEEKYEFLLNYHPEIYKRCKLKDIASFLNICPETLSRVRKKKCNKIEINQRTQMVYLCEDST